MSNPLVRNTIVAVLADPDVQYINFVIGGYDFRPEHYQRVSSAVSSGQLDTRFNPGQADDAWYDSSCNLFSLRSPFADTNTKKALIIHEATHASCDLRNLRNMCVDTSEAAGYIAQCIFLRRKTSPQQIRQGYRLTSTDGNIDWVLEKAWEIAGDILTNGFTHRQKTQELMERVRLCPIYHTPGAAVSPVAGYNG